MDLRTIASRLIPSDLLELVIRFAMNDAVEQLTIENKPITKDNLYSALYDRKAVERALSQNDRQMETERLIERYADEGWKKEAAAGRYQVVAMTPEELEYIKELTSTDIARWEQALNSRSPRLEPARRMQVNTYLKQKREFLTYLTRNNH